MPVVHVAIPVYNNAPTIYDIAKKSRDQLHNIIVIDDGSTDADLTQLLSSLDVTVLKHQTNQGKGNALLTAFHHAHKNGAQYLITLDGDGQHSPDDIPHFLPHLEAHTILIGYRKHVTGHMPNSSRFGRDFSDFLITTQSGGHAQDTQSGFRAYPLHPILQLNLHSHHYNLEMEIITRAQWAGLKTASIPIHVHYPSKEKSQSHFHPIKDNLRISRLHTNLILRQLLPWPHKKIINSKFSLQDFLFPNSNPIGLATTTALTLIMSIVLWPLGFLPVTYLTFRLHQNKFAALICLLICTPTFIPKLCQSLGQKLIPPPHPTLQWIAGSHALALPLALTAGWLTYCLAKKSRQNQPQINTDEHR